MPGRRRSVYLSPYLDRRLSAMSERLGWPKTHLISAALLRYLNDLEKRAEESSRERALRHLGEADRKS